MKFETSDLVLALLATLVVAAALIADRYDQGASVNVATALPGVLLGVGVLAASMYVSWVAGLVLGVLGGGGAWVWSVRRRGPRGQGPATTPGHVWWAWLPFEEKAGGKDRPVLIVRDEGGRHVYVRKITSQEPPGKVASQYTPVSWNGSGKARSWCRTGGPTARIPRHNLRRVAGVAYRV